MIGSVYGAQLAAAGHSVSVLDHHAKRQQLSTDRLTIRDAKTGHEVSSPVTVVDNPTNETYDLILIAVRSDQLPSACSTVARVSGEPALLFFGNNPSGRSALPDGLPGVACLGFPGVGGSFDGNTVEYLRIPQQPTAFEDGTDPRISETVRALNERGFKTQPVTNMDGWLKYHSMFVACVAAALYRCNTAAATLAADRRTLSLMCRAITEGFAGLRRQNISGAPRNLAFLHRAVLQPIAVSYWARTLHSPMGELCFAAHARHAEDEMRALAAATITRVGRDDRMTKLRLLLDG